MMGKLAHLAATPWPWLVAAAIVLLVALSRDSFALTDFSYRFPLIGKLARYSKDYSETSRGGWLNVEASLCRDYARHIAAMSREEFDRNCEYMRKAYDHGRKPVPPLIWGGILVLVALEAVGFSFLLSGYMAMESSANTRMLISVAIVAVLALILVWVTHSAGHQLYRTNLLRSCFQQFQAHAIHSRNGEGSQPYTSRIISLRENQSVDDENVPSHVQCANRVVTRPDDRGTYAWVWAAGIMIVTIAAISTFMRIETLHALNAADTTGTAGLFGNAPAPRQTSSASDYAAMSSFGILAIIFVVTQLVSVGVGFRYGFAGKQSAEAFRATRGCADYKTYFLPTLRRIRIADLRLTTLHRLMERRLPYEINWARTFFDYISEEQRDGATDLQGRPLDDDARPAAAPVAAATTRRGSDAVREVMPSEPGPPDPGVVDFPAPKPQAAP